METVLELRQCAVLTCTNTADPRWFARDVNGRAVMICDGHLLPPQANEVANGPPDPSAQDLAERVVHNGYAPTFGEVERIAQGLLASLAKHTADLSELRDLADLANAALNAATLSELRAVKQSWREARYAKEVVALEATIAKMWESTQRNGVLIARCRHCGFEALQFADATIEDHMKACPHPNGNG